jgi:hypothetical protein
MIILDFPSVSTYTLPRIFNLYTVHICLSWSLQEPGTSLCSSSLSIYREASHSHWIPIVAVSAKSASDRRFMLIKSKMHGPGFCNTGFPSALRCSNAEREIVVLTYIPAALWRQCGPKSKVDEDRVFLSVPDLIALMLASQLCTYLFDTWVGKCAFLAMFGEHNGLFRDRMHTRMTFLLGSQPLDLAEEPTVYPSRRALVPTLGFGTTGMYGRGRKGPPAFRSIYQISQLTPRRPRHWIQCTIHPT